MTQKSSDELEEYRRRTSNDGMFLRFASGRTRGFFVRQTLTVVGSATIAAMASVALGLLTAVIAVLGEALDCYVLSRIARRYKDKPVPAYCRRIAMLTGGLQATSISICVAICWQYIPEDSARFFAASFLMAAAINAGLVKRFFEAGANLRLSIYALTGAVMLAVDHWRTPEYAGPTEVFFLATALILGYTSMLFIRATLRGQVKRDAFELAVLENAAALQESKARESELAERLSMVAKYANDSVIFTKPDGRIEWVNDAFTRISGYSLEEAVGKQPSELLNAEETAPEALAILGRSYAENKPVRVELLNRTRDGSRVWMDVSLTPVLKPDGSPDVFIAVERDITEAKDHAEALAKARVEAEAAAYAKSQFLASMSHEIRTPMNGVIGMAELLMETPLEPRQQHYVTTIIDSGRALVTIINDVLDLSKLQANKSEIQRASFSVNSCVGRAVDLMQPTAMKKGLTLSVETSPEMSMSLGDAGRLRQILLNLVGNAVKFTTKGMVKVKVTHEALDGEDEITISVEDTGIGIPADRLGQVFESFTQADSTITKQFGGTGLGLTISRLLAQRMGGDITVASDYGKGSVFTLTLRLERTSQAEDISELTPQPIPKTDLRLLVAEDNATNMLITHKLLERCVGSIVEALNGKEAVAAYRKSPPDLVLMDVSMPEMSGDDAARAIRAYEAEAGLPRCPIVALTAYSSQDEEASCLAAGMDAVITKPLVRAELYDLIEQTVKLRDHFDLCPPNAVDRLSKGGSKWSTSLRASGTTSGRSTRSSAH